MSLAPHNLGDLIGKAPSAKVAIIDLLNFGSPREVSYGELEELTRSVARGLLRRGVKAGERAAILSENRVEFIAAFLGAMRAGIIPVPVNFKLPQSAIDFIMKDAAVKLCFTDEVHNAKCASANEIIVFGRDGGSGFGDFLVREGDFTDFVAGPDDIAMILYTSGSSGRPKGVPLTHQGQLWAIAARNRTASNLPEHRFLVAAPLYHMNALFAVKFILAAGSSAVLMPRFEAPKYIAAIDRHKCTWLTSVPTMMAMILREKDALAKADLSSVQVAAMGSAPVTDALVQAVKNLFPNARVQINYGTTEGGPAVFGNHPAGVPRPMQSMGYPLPDIGIRLVRDNDKDANEGRLQLRTPAQMKAYLNLPDQTAKAITKDGFYDTGDIVRRDEQGFYYFVGRADDMFVCGGENIFPEHVERILEKHPQVLQACVVPVADEIKGEKPVAFIVARNSREFDPENLKQFVLGNAPAYMHPRRIFLLGEMPLAGTNKIDRALLRQKAAAEMERMASA